MQAFTYIQARAITITHKHYHAQARAKAQTRSQSQHQVHWLFYYLFLRAQANPICPNEVPVVAPTKKHRGMVPAVEVGRHTKADHHRKTLVEAVRSGNPNKATRTVSNTTDLLGGVDFSEGTISSPLAVALGGCDTTSIRTLLAAKANPNVPGVWDIVPLHHGIVKLLVDAGLDTSEPAGEERIVDTLFRRTEKERDLENVTDVVGYLMDQQGVNPSRASLFYYLLGCVNSSIYFDGDVLEWLLEARGAVTYVDNGPFTRGATPAHYAVQLQPAQACKTLQIMADYDWGANSVEPGNDGALSMDNDTGCRDPIDMDGAKYPLLTYVAIRGAKDTLAMLLTEFDADPNVGGQHGMTPLHVVCACAPEPAPMATMLIAAKGDPNQTDDDGNTPLHYAMCNIMPSIDPPGPSAVANLLIAAKADPEVTNNAGRTANSFVAQSALADSNLFDGIFA